VSTTNIKSKLAVTNSFTAKYKERAVFIMTRKGAVKVTVVGTMQRGVTTLLPLAPPLAMS